MKKVLVTGASGFIGSATLNPLKIKGYEVHGVYHHADLSGSRNKPGIIWHHTDLLNDNDRKTLIEDLKPDVLLHTAWYVKHGKYVTAPENKDWADASADLFEQFSQNGGQRVVVTGSCLEYDWTSSNNEDAVICSEAKTRLSEATPYGKAKNDLHRHLKKVSLPEGYAWGRIFNIYGPEEPSTRLFPKLIDTITQGTPLEVWMPSYVRDYLFAEDVGECFAKLVASDFQGPVNIASGSPVRLDFVAETLGEILGVSPKIQAKVVDPPPSPTAPLKLLADCEILNSKLGWRPNYTLESGLKKMLRVLGRL